MAEVSIYSCETLSTSSEMDAILRISLVTQIGGGERKTERGTEGEIERGIYIYIDGEMERERDRERERERERDREKEREREMER